MGEKRRSYPKRPIVKRSVVKASKNISPRTKVAPRSRRG